MKIAVEFEVRDLQTLKNVIALGMAHGVYTEADLKIVDSFHSDGRLDVHGGALKTLRVKLSQEKHCSDEGTIKPLRRFKRKHTTVVGGG